jgi:hypothetical protein
MYAMKSTFYTAVKGYTPCLVGTIVQYHSKDKSGAVSCSHLAFEYVLQSGGESYKRSCTSFKGTIAIHRTLWPYPSVYTNNSAVSGWCCGYEVLLLINVWETFEFRAGSILPSIHQVTRLLTRQPFPYSVLIVGGVGCFIVSRQTRTTITISCPVSA